MSFRRAGCLSLTLMTLVRVALGASSSTTTLTPNPTTAYTSGANSTVVLTATVTSGASGTVTFKDGSGVISCSAGNPVLSGGSATCTTTFSTEGLHALSAVYPGDTNFLGSTGTANVFVQNHATGSANLYCNAGPISSNGSSQNGSSSTSPYPSVIFVGDGNNTDIAGAVSTASVQLKNFSTNTER